MVMDLGGLIGVEISGEGSLIGCDVSGEGDQTRLNEKEIGVKGKEAEIGTLIERNDGLDEVRVCVSRLDLTANLKPLGGTSSEITSQITNQLAGLKKQKTKP